MNINRPKKRRFVTTDKDHGSKLNGFRCVILLLAFLINFFGVISSSCMAIRYKRKTFLLIFLFLSTFIIGSAQSESYELSNIHTIDEQAEVPNYVEVSDEGLPPDHYLQLVQMISSFKFTILPENRARDLFEELTRDSKARMKIPGGLCSRRRIYIQDLLKKMRIISGKILIKCPSNNGRLRLQDQVSRRYITYTNFHDTNIVVINTGTTQEFRIMDLQFQESPVSLHDYLTQIEASQKIRPAKRRGNSSGLCYWSISSNSLTY